MENLNVMSMFDMTTLNTPMLITAIFGIVLFVAFIILGIGAIDNIETETGVLSIITAVLYGAAVFVTACVCSNFDLFQKLKEVSDPGAVILMGLALLFILAMLAMLIVTVNVLDLEHKVARVIFFIVLAYVFYFALERFEITADYTFLGPVASGLIFQIFALCGNGTGVFASRVAFRVFSVIFIIALIALFFIFGLPYIIDLIKNENGSRADAAETFGNFISMIRSSFTDMNVAQWATIIAVVVTIIVAICRIINEFGEDRYLAIMMIPMALVYGCVFFLTFGTVMMMKSAVIYIFAFVCILLTLITYMAIKKNNFLTSFIFVLVPFIIAIPVWGLFGFLYQSNQDDLFLYIIQFAIFAVALISQIVSMCKHSGGSGRDYDPVMDMTGDEEFIDEDGGSIDVSDM